MRRGWRSWPSTTLRRSLLAADEPTERPRSPLPPKVLAQLHFFHIFHFTNVKQFNTTCLPPIPALRMAPRHRVLLWTTLIMLACYTLCNETASVKKKQQRPQNGRKSVQNGQGNNPPPMDQNQLPPEGKPPGETHIGTIEDGAQLPPSTEVSTTEPSTSKSTTFKTTASTQPSTTSSTRRPTTSLPTTTTKRTTTTSEPPTKRTTKRRTTKTTKMSSTVEPTIWTKWWMIMLYAFIGLAILSGLIFVIYCFLIPLCCPLCCNHDKKRDQSKEQKKVKLRALDTNPEEMHFACTQIKKMGPVVVHKQLMLPTEKELLADDEIQIEKERRLQFNLCQCHEVGSDFELVVDADGKRAPESTRSNAETAGRSEYISTTGPKGATDGGDYEWDDDGQDEGNYSDNIGLASDAASGLDDAASSSHLLESPQPDETASPQLIDEQLQTVMITNAGSAMDSFVVNVDKPPMAAARGGQQLAAGNDDPYQL